MVSKLILIIALAASNAGEAQTARVCGMQGARQLLEA